MSIFNRAAFSKRLHVALKQRKISMRQAAKAIGISPATISRVCSGRPPDIDSYERITRWLGEKR